MTLQPGKFTTIIIQITRRHWNNIQENWIQPHIKGTVHVAVLLVLNLETLLKMGLKNRGTVINCKHLLL